MALKDWRQRKSGNIISYYKDDLEIRIIYDYSLFIWKVVLLQNDEYIERLGRSQSKGLTGRQEAIKISKDYMRNH